MPSDKFQNKYRIPSARWQSWDYGSNAAYFITICTADREHYFGRIEKRIIDSQCTIETRCTVETQCIASLPVNTTDPPTTINEMILSEIGKIVESEWLKTPEIRPDMNIVLDEFRVMPNHFHAIIIIGENRYNTEYLNNRNDGDDPHHIDAPYDRA